MENLGIVNVIESIFDVENRLDYLYVDNGANINERAQKLVLAF